MEERERSRSRSPRRVRRVEQVVGRWLRRSRDSLSRKSSRSDDGSQQHFKVKETVEVIRDSVLDSHGFTLSTQLPLLVRDIIPGGPADGRLLPGDQVLKVNNKAIDDLSPEYVDNMIRQCQDSVTVTVLRNMLNPKSSFMSAEKRARLRRNPVKVRFAEEVLVNGHTQGNSLLFLPNVLKVYLENGQTKAFKFDKTTTVKDIVLTLKDKLSIRSIEYFSLVLEQQYSITKLLLLHEDELIQKVVQKKDSHDYRCLFRVCFIPRDPVDLLHDDPVAFEYLFHQSVGDVLQERFAVEMKCNTALRLAALHMHERLASCGQTTRASIKNIIKEFGLESFISPTLLRNMREKDLRKALTGHMKKIQSLLEPRQKVISVPQARLAYLTQMAELISYSGRSYNATMLLQDRESLVSLLVGARFGVSQILNHKLNMISTIIDFHYISRVEVLSESDRVSMLKIYLHDIQPLALLMDSIAAKDLACLLAGYCKLLVDPNMNVFRWGPRPKIRRIPLKEGFGFRCGSDSEDSSDEDYSMDNLLDTPVSEDTLSTHTNEDREDEKGEEKEEAKINKVRVIVTRTDDEEKVVGEIALEGTSTCGSIEDEDYAARVDALLETGWYTDPRVNSSFSSLSSNSFNNFEEISKISSTWPTQLDTFQEETPKSDQATGASKLDVHYPYLLEIPEHPNRKEKLLPPSGLLYDKHSGLRYSDLSQLSDSLPSPPEASDDALSDLEELNKDENKNYSPADIDAVLASGSSNSIKSTVAGFNVQALLARIRSHPACKNDLRNSNLNQKEEVKSKGPLSRPKVQPPPPPLKTVSRVSELLKEARNSGSESEDEFFDAQDHLTPPILEQPAEKKVNGINGMGHTIKQTDAKTTVVEPAAFKNRLDKPHDDGALPINKNNQKEDPSIPKDFIPAKSILNNAELESHQKSVILLPQPDMLESKTISNNHILEKASQQSNGDIPGRNSHMPSELLEMEPDTMEFKPVSTAGPPLSSPLITAVRHIKSQKPTTMDPAIVSNNTQNIIKPIDPKQKITVEADRRAIRGNANTAVTVTSASSLTESPPPSVTMKGSISMEPQEPFGTGRGFSSRSSSGRLSASALRGKIQDMPWYLTRSQEILGTVALRNDKFINTKVSKDASESKDSQKESPKFTSVPALNDWKEKDAEVVVVKLKDGPQDIASHDNLERPSPPSSTCTPPRDACGCHTVYANCFSGNSEDLCGFDDDLTVYEFSRQKRVNKPPQISTAPSSAPSSNILSLLRDSPHPLSASSELSPLFTPPRPRPLGYNPLDNPLRDLQERRYVTGLKGTGLKGGYSSLHKDIDELLLVLKNGETAINPPGQKGPCEKASGMNGNLFSETERCLVQAEARRLASGCQRATRVGWAPDDALLSLGNSFGALVHLAAACLQVSCPDCGSCHGDIDGTEALRKLQEIVCLYKEFVIAVEAAREGEGVRLLAKQCTVLISTVFCLTQLFRTHTPDTDNRPLPLNF
ncbi:FERM and PDZ domain-containing protein 1 [Bagarius yarrelli]|uniref:FERM and PDZ domain-containing protein 1 n=1 Tax=Bagarius yarrelli TaxID=175774 RepID=A0A556VAW1_BAGYA|nr:FERM and PDZ domain-containing protein 1 [Bagarius yarrelli]